MYTVLMVVLALFLVCLNGFFVAAEFAFVKVRKTQLELLAANGDKRAKLALFGVTHLDAYLSVCQLGITLASLGLGWLGEPAVAQLLRPVLEFSGITNPAVVTSISVAVGFSIITLLHVVFGELAPKSISIQKAEAVVLLLALPMRLVHIICLPLVTIMNGISNAFLRLVGMHTATETEASHSAEELRMLVVDSSKRGELDKGEGRLLDNIFAFYDKLAKDIMVHRTDVIAVDVSCPREEFLKIAHESGHTRFPIYEDNRDNIIGFVHIRDVLHGREDTGLAGMVREPLYAYELMHLDRLLTLLQKNHQQFCVVVDEYGDWQGILTMEDLLEAIVGDIQDEFDKEDQEVVQESEGVYSVSGDLSIDELAEHLDIECDDPALDQYKIIAAHFHEILDRLPREGDAITLCRKRFTVTNMERNRVRRVRVENAPEPEEARPAG